jgi:hypothetical protein
MSVTEVVVTCGRIMHAGICGFGGIALSVPGLRRTLWGNPVQQTTDDWRRL